MLLSCVTFKNTLLVNFVFVVKSYNINICIWKNLDGTEIMEYARHEMLLSTTRKTV